MAKLKDVLQYVAYSTSLDIIERTDNQWVHLFPVCDLITREVIEEHHSELLEREMDGGIHAEGIRRDRLVMPIKKEDKIMKYEVIMEKGDYALISRGEKLKEYAVVYGLDKERNEWACKSGYWAYEYDGIETGNKARALAHAIDLFRARTEKNYISRARLEELATRFKDGMFEIDEDYAMEYINDNCDMEDYEKEFIGIGGEE